MEDLYFRPNPVNADEVWAIPTGQRLRFSLRYLTLTVYLTLLVTRPQTPVQGLQAKPKVFIKQQGKYVGETKLFSICLIARGPNKGIELTIRDCITIHVKGIQMHFTDRPLAVFFKTAFIISAHKK